MVEAEAERRRRSERWREERTEVMGRAIGGEEPREERMKEPEERAPGMSGGDSGEMGP